MPIKENTIERAIVPYNPSTANVINKDRYNLYAPTGGINKIGMAGYSAVDFTVKDQIVYASDTLKDTFVWRVNVAQNVVLPEDIIFNADGDKTPNVWYYNFTHSIIDKRENGKNVYKTVTGILIVGVSFWEAPNYVLSETFLAEGRLWTRELELIGDKVQEVTDFVPVGIETVSMVEQYAIAAAASAAASAASADESATSADESATSADESMQYRDQSQEYANQSKSSANSAANSAELARQYAEIGIQLNVDYTSVDTLPRPGSSRYIYLIPANPDLDGQQDIYDEYVWVADENDYELLGTTRVDLTSYAKKPIYYIPIDSDWGLNYQ